MLLMASAEIENLIEADRAMYFECRTLVEEIVKTFGAEYYKDKEYVMFMKNYNKNKK